MDLNTPFAFTKKFIVVFYRILVMTTPIWGLTFMAIVVMSWIFAEAEQVGFGEALYFAGVTALTIGYGDIVPLTATGKILCVIMGILGVITTGIIVAVAIQAMKITYKEVIDGARKQLEHIGKI